MKQKYQSIKHKISIAIVTTSTIVLFLTGLTYVIYEFFNFRNHTVERVSILAEVIARNSTASLAFNSPEDAHEILSALRSRESLLIAVLYDKDGKVFSNFPEKPLRSLPPMDIRKNGYFFENRFLHILEPVILAERQIGTLYMQYDMSAMSKQFQFFGVAVMVMFLLSLGLAYLLSSRLQRRISQPVVELAEVANVVSRKSDYSVRGVKQANDEIGELTDAFNHMLIQIEKQNKALTESEQRFRALADNIAQMAWIADENGEITWYNKRWFEFTGTSPESMKDLDWQTIIYPEHWERVARNFTTSMKEGIIWEDTFLLLGEDDGFHWFLSRAVPIYDENGKVSNWFGTNTDISELREKEEALQMSEEFSRTLFQSSPDCVQALNLPGELLTTNLSGLQMLEIDNDNTIGSLWTDLWKGEYHSEALGAIRKAREGREIGHFQGETHTTKGKSRWWDVMIAPVYGSEGHIERLVAVSRDISKIKELERQKDDFMSIASHELKTPVTSIKAFTQILKNQFEKKDDTQSANLLGKMNVQVDKLISLINDLLDITKIEQGRIQYHVKEFDFNQLVRELVEDIQRAAIKHRIEVHLTATASVAGDRDRIGQVISNFLTNAIKYSPMADSVVVGSELQHPDQLIFFVRDFGLGLSEEDSSKVFERFFRVTGPAQHTYPGLGLGLYISAEIIKRHNGRIWVDSNLDIGSVFSFSLPLK